MSVAMLVGDHYAFPWDEQDIWWLDQEWRPALAKAGDGPYADPRLNVRLDTLGWSARVQHCFDNDGIVTVGDLVQKTEAEFLRTPNIGRKSLNEVAHALELMGLRWGMELQQAEMADAPFLFEWDY